MIVLSGGKIVSILSVASLGGGGGGWEGVWRREEGGGYSQQFLNGEAPLRGATHYLLAPLSPKVIFSLNDKNTFFG